MIRDWTWLATLAALVLGLAACGGGDDDDDDDDVPVDAGLDGGRDGGPRPDGGVECWGNPCQDALDDCIGRANDRVCFEERDALQGGEPVPYGSPQRPLVDTDYQPVTGVTFEQIAFQDGYCVLAVPATAADPNGCFDDGDCDLPDSPGCFGACLGFTGENGQTQGCFRACDPLSATNDPCRDGYQCDLGTAACLPGCLTDEECKTAIEDTNGNGEIDAFNFGTNRNGDRWVYDAASGATCNPETFRCENPGTPGVSAGDPCERSSQCMEEGTCLLEANGWVGGGYCTKLDCNVTGRGCGEGEACQSKGVGQPLCLQACTLAGEAGTEDEIGPGGNGQGCREGYRCEWSGIATATTPNPLASCVPGNYNLITENNVGAACTRDADCYSRFGAGDCLLRDLDGNGAADVGMCVLEGCRQDDQIRSTPLPQGLDEAAYCGTGNECIRVSADVGSLANPLEFWCVDGCTSGNECPAMGLTVTVEGTVRDINFACNDGFNVGEADGFCWFSCVGRDAAGAAVLDSSMCPTNYTCLNLGGDGVCVENAPG